MSGEAGKGSRPRPQSKKQWYKSKLWDHIDTKKKEALKNNKKEK